MKKAIKIGLIALLTATLAVVCVTFAEDKDEVPRTHR